IATSNMIVIVILTVIIVCFYIIFQNLGGVNNTTSTFINTETTGMHLLEIIMWGSVLFLIIINGFQYIFGIDVKTSIKNIFSDVPEIDIAIASRNDVGQNKQKKKKKRKKGKNPEIMIEKQVFHIPVNKYTYNDARALCGSYGGRLATYNEIEKAYKRGGEWCSYGWSHNQLALFPTQKNTYNKLQKIKGHKHDCGRAGINGGFIANPNAKFGVNCYAPKPVMDKREQQYMESLNTYPLGYEEKEFKKKVNFYRKHRDKILVAPFNKNSWSQV
ncbi:hypothetical protein OAI84_00545, partial [bacterium]|nr:hypothetical protein [bacterium]